MKSKRSAGEGSIRRLKSGNWMGELMDGYRPDGKRNILYFTAKTKAEVLSALRHYQLDREKNVHVDPKLSFPAWSAQWFSDYRSQVQPSTYAGYQYTLKILDTHFEATKLCELRPITINRFLDQLVDRGYSISQIHKCRTMLIQILDYAVDNGILSYNAAQRSKRITSRNPLLHPATRVRDSFTADELKTLFDTLPDDLLGTSIRVLLVTGIRIQELLALTPACIAPDGTKLCVTQAIQTVHGVPHIGPPKSRSSCREIPVSPPFRQHLIRLRQFATDGLLWHVPDTDTPRSVGTFRRMYYRALKDIPSVRALSPHCCRHTYLTNLELQHMPLEVIARLAGHASINTTNNYLHFSFDTLMQAIQDIPLYTAAGA